MAEKLFASVDTDPNLRDSSGMEHPLTVAARSRNLEFVRFLLKKGAYATPAQFIFKPYLPSPRPETPLSIAVGNGQLEMVRLLLEFKPVICDLRCSVNVASLDANNHESLGMILDSCADLNERDGFADGYHWDAMIHDAVLTGSSVLLEGLLDRDADVNLTSLEGYTLLHLAAMSGSAHIQYLLSKGADMTIENCWGHTPLRTAVEEHCPEARDEMLAYTTRHASAGEAEPELASAPHNE
jgi:ankyrin repeat protein